MKKVMYSRRYTKERKTNVEIISEFRSMYVKEKAVSVRKEKNETLCSAELNTEVGIADMIERFNDYGQGLKFTSVQT